MSELCSQSRFRVLLVFIRDKPVEETTFPCICTRKGVTTIAYDDIFQQKIVVIVHPHFYYNAHQANSYNLNKTLKIDFKKVMKSKDPNQCRWKESYNNSK